MVVENQGKGGGYMSKFITVESGRYKGEIVGFSKEYNAFMIKDLFICKRNVAEFRIVKVKPFAYCKMVGYLCRIVWRDGTQSEFTADGGLLEAIRNSLTATIYPEKR